MKTEDLSSSAGANAGNETEPDVNASTSANAKTVTAVNADASTVSAMTVPLMDATVETNAQKTPWIHAHA